MVFPRTFVFYAVSATPLDAPKKAGNGIGGTSKAGRNGKTINSKTNFIIQKEEIYVSNCHSCCNVNPNINARSNKSVIFPGAKKYWTTQLNYVSEDPSSS